MPSAVPLSRSKDFEHQSLEFWHQNRFPWLRIGFLGSAWAHGLGRSWLQSVAELVMIAARGPINCGDHKSPTLCPPQEPGGFS